MAHPKDTLNLVADIGGTNTRVALAEGPRLLPETIRRYANKEYPGLETVLRKFVEDEGGVDTKAASVAVAGPVRDGRGSLTNLNWTIDEETLARATSAETVSILNDLQAQGHALGHLPEESITPVIPNPEASDRAARLVIGVGTGFNIAPVYEAPGGRLVPPAEAGHATLPARNERDLSLSKFLATFHGFPSIEDAITGRGVERIYHWLGREADDPAEKSSKDVMAGADGADPRAVEAVHYFCQLLGSEAGNLALIHLPFGGIYLVGGMSRAMLPHFAAAGFTAAFRDKGRFSGFMGNFGVSVVEDDYAALIGSAHHLHALAG